MFKYRLEVTKQKFIIAPPRNSGFPSYVLILISKRHFRISPIFANLRKIINKKLRGESRLAFEFFYFQAVLQKKYLPGGVDYVPRKR